MHTHTANTFPCMQAVRDDYHTVLDKDDFLMMIDRHSPAIGLKIPSDPAWDVTPLVNPAKVC